MQLSRLLTSTLLALGEVGVTAAAPSHTGREKCKHPTVRKEWRAMSEFERLDYIAAVQCLMAAPGETTSTFVGAVSRHADFQALHITQTDYIHWVGHFLPWHRYLLHLFSTALSSTCAYHAGVPYWDWTLDAASSASAFLASPVFSPTTGFGGNGPYLTDDEIAEFPASWITPGDIPDRTGGGCVPDGPFANLSVPLGPGNTTEHTPHCLRRDFSATLALASLNPAVEVWIRDADDFFDFTHRTEGLTLGIENMTVHGGGHWAVGGQIGDMANTYSSPGDPLFYLHHGALDRMWNRWQRADWPARRDDIGGPDTQWAYPYNYFGDIPYENVTLDYVMDFGLVGGQVPIRDVMDIENDELCYTYE